MAFARQPRLSMHSAFAEALESRYLLADLTIVQENLLTGNPKSQWDITGNGDTSIQGYATDISINRGSTVQFKIDVPSLAEYRIDIYRMGYYQGNGARKVTTIPSSQTASVDQPNFIRDAATGLIDAGNWSVTASWNVPADATSGIYFGKLVREDTGGASHIVFVVRNDASTSDIIMHTGDTTWQAYNEWGGASIYRGNGPGAGGRAYKVSYNRPFATRGQDPGYGKENWVFYSEYPMVRFLEQNGYDVAYQAGVDTERIPNVLQQHDTFLSVGHDEYWSREQRNALISARDAGVDLTFFGGNLMYWKIRWENGIAGGNAAYRTLVCYKESLHNGNLDPSPIWTGLWRDGRFSSDGGWAENNTIGSYALVNRGPNPVGTAFEVPDWAGKFRLWRNTNLINLAPNTVASVGDSVLGYEWDTDFENGQRPAGLIGLSQTTQTAEILDPFGGSQGLGPATHKITMYRDGAALVVNAGMIQWAWGLDANHDGTRSDGTPAATDARIRQATVNIFADMGVQPATLSAGLVAGTASTDTVGPTSIFSSTSTIVTSGGYATVRGSSADTGGGRVAGAEVSIDGGISWHPATGRGDWTYTWIPSTFGPATVRVRAIDDSANIGAALVGNFNIQQGAGGISIWSDTTTPTVFSNVDTQAVELGLKFRSDIAGFITGIRFYKGLFNTGTHVGSLWTSTGALLGSATFVNETASGWQTVLFGSAVPISANTTYVASYHTNVGRYSNDAQFFATTGVDRANLHALADGVAGGNGVYKYGGGSVFPNETFSATNYWVDVLFDATAADTIAPTVIVRSPAPGSAGVSTGARVTATFSEPVQSSTISLVLRDAANNVVPSTNSYDGPSRTVTLAPNTALANGGTYTATLGGAKDLAGNTMAGPLVWSFSTIVVGGEVSIWTDDVPVNDSDPDTAAVELGMRFRSDVAGSVTGVKFYKGSGNTGVHIGNLWTDTGTLLASTTFAGETSTGWQTARFTTPIAISANTTYVVSYHTDTGRYANDDNYFTTQIDVAPLHALASGGSGANGVYRYGASGFPTDSYQATNYWVDLLFTAGSGVDTTPPTLTAKTPVAGATGVPRTTTVTATFSETIQSSTLSFVLRNASNNVVSSSVEYNATTRTATLTPASQLASSATYTATVSGVKDTAGNTMTLVSWSFTTIDTTRPTITGRSPANNATGVPRSVKPTVTFSEPMNPSTINTTTVQLRRGTSTVAATVAYNAATRTVTITPSATLAALTTYTVRVTGGSSGVKDVAGNALATTSSASFTTGSSALARAPGDDGDSFPAIDPVVLDVLLPDDEDGELDTLLS